jgi:hypothetical protein
VFSGCALRGGVFRLRLQRPYWRRVDKVNIGSQPKSSASFSVVAEIPRVLGNAADNWRYSWTMLLCSSYARLYRQSWMHCLLIDCFFAEFSGNKAMAWELFHPWW